MAKSELLLRVSGPFGTQVNGHLRASISFPLGPDAWATLSSGDRLKYEAGRPVATLAVAQRYSVPVEWAQALGEARDVDDEASSAVRSRWPDGLASFCSEESRRLRALARDSYSLIRWRWAPYVDGGTNFNCVGRVEWSSTDSDWAPIDLGRSLSAGRALAQLPLGETVESGLASFGSLGDGEPIGREIWHAAHRAGGATGLVLAVTAVEVEMKRLLAMMSPSSEWLLVNLPAPPLDKMLRSYLPTLDGYRPEYGPSRKLIGRLKRAIELRNTLIHVGPDQGTAWGTALEPERFEEHLSVSSDVLWLLDVQRGHDWALHHRTPQTQFELGLLRDAPAPLPPRTFRVPPDPNHV